MYIHIYTQFLIYKYIQYFFVWERGVEIEADIWRAMGAAGWVAGGCLVGAEGGWVTAAAAGAAGAAGVWRSGWVGWAG